MRLATRLLYLFIGAVLGSFLSVSCLEWAAAPAIVDRTFEPLDVDIVDISKIEGNRYVPDADQLELLDEDIAYHFVTLTAVAANTWTHICTIGPVVYVRRQGDGDWHITLDNGRAQVVAEIITLIPLPAPRKGQRIKVCGITRTDQRHGWPEIHPVERWTVAP